MASATPKPDMVARARAAAESPNVTITEEDLMEEGWLKAYSEAYFEFHPEDRPRCSQPVSSLRSVRSVPPAAIDLNMTYTLRPGTGEEPLAKEPPAEAHAD